MSAIDTTTLMNNARCIESCVPEGMQLAVLINLFAQIAGMSTDPNTLMQAARCMTCIPEGDRMGVLIYLADQIAQGGGGGGGGSQTPWTSDIDAAGKNITNLGTVNGVKVYRALLTQSGTDAPVAIVKENSLGGVPVFTRTGVGLYPVTLAGAFGETKTLIFFGPAFNTGTGKATYDSVTDDSFRLAITDGGDLNDDVLFNTPIEILVYQT